MNKYMVYVDYTADCDKGTEYKELDAAEAIAAMSEAEGYLAEDVYLISIWQREGRGKKNEANFTEVLVNRGHGWRAKDSKHSEVTWAGTFTKGYKGDIYHTEMHMVEA